MFYSGNFLSPAALQETTAARRLLPLPRRARQPKKQAPAVATGTISEEASEVLQGLDARGALPGEALARR